MIIGRILCSYKLMFCSEIFSCLAFELFVTCKKSCHFPNELIYRRPENKLLKMANAKISGCLLIGLLVITFLFDAGIVCKGFSAWVFSAAQGPITARHFTCVFFSVGIND